MILVLNLVFNLVFNFQVPTTGGSYTVHYFNTWKILLKCFAITIDLVIFCRNRILKVAQAYKGELAFAVSNKDEFQHELNEYGVEFTPSDKPIVTAKNSKGQKFKMEDEFS